MAKRRMSEGLRRYILDAIRAEKMTPTIEALRAEEKRIALWIVDEALDKESKRLLKKIPDTWMDEADEVYAYLGGERRRFSLYESMKLPRIFSWSAGDSMPRFPAGHPITQAMRDHEANATKLGEELFKLEKEIKATLAAFKYVEDLIAHWPEVEKYIPAPDVPAPCTLPAILIPSLNERLNALPVT